MAELECSQSPGCDYDTGKHGWACPKARVMADLRYWKRRIEADYRESPPT